MFRLRCVPIVIVLTAIAAGLAGPALCAGARPEPMPCCLADGDCDAALGRPSCCLDQPGDTGRSDAGTLDKMARTLAAPALPEPAPDTTPIAGTRPEAQPDPGDPPPLFLLHAAFLC